MSKRIKSVDVHYEERHGEWWITAYFPALGLYKHLAIFVGDDNENAIDQARMFGAEVTVHNKTSTSFYQVAPYAESTA